MKSLVKIFNNELYGGLIILLIFLILLLSSCAIRDEIKPETLQSFQTGSKDTVT